jgi:hypothetical protein
MLPKKQRQNAMGLWQQQQSGAMQLYSAQDNHTINNYVLRKTIGKKRGKKICCP